jgi:ribosome biogenesis GTPase
MIFLPKGGVVIDTPGMREFHLWGVSEGAKETFPEIEALAPGCHFRDCSHTQEKDCAVLAALAAGTLPRERHESFVKLQREIGFMREAEKQAGWQTRRKSDRVAHQVFNKGTAHHAQK